MGCALLLALDAFFLRWVWLHFDHWGFWDWDYQMTLLEVARRTILEHHQLPLWNPYIGGGVSLVGNTLNHVWAPCFALILLFGTVSGVKLCIAVYLVLAQVGMWRLARERGQQPVAAFLAAIVFSLGGVFALRLTHGHFEWIAIAWMPHILFYLHRARSGANRRSVWLGGIALAFVFLDGGPYQFAFFAVFACAYAAALAIESSSPRALKDLALMGAISAGVAAIKLVPVYEIVRRYPRSETAVNFYSAPFTPTAGEILHQMFVSRAQGHDPEAWMPYILNVGCYVGWLPLLLVAYALARNFRKNAIWFGLALVFLWIALGPAAPIDLWALLHGAPPFSLLRVPSRFSFCVLIVLALLAGDGLQQLIATLQTRMPSAPDKRRRIWPQAVGVAIAVFVAGDLAWVNGRILRVAFSVPAMEIEPQENFKQYLSSPYVDRYIDRALFDTQRHWPSGVFPAVLENRGVLQTFRTIRSGTFAVPFSLRGYKGEAWMDQEPGAVVARHITPNTIEIETDGREGLLFLNSNYDPGWKTIAPNGSPISARGRLAVRLAEGTTRVTLRFQPVTFELGVLVSGLTLAYGLSLALRRHFIR